MRDEFNPKALQDPDARPIDVTMTVNGTPHNTSGWPGDTLLIDYLHEVLRLTGTKFSCGIGACGSCKVAVRAEPGLPFMPVLACFARLSSVNNMEIVTVEGVGSEADLHPLQHAFVENFAFQCGYSTPGFVMAGFVLIDQLRHRPIAESELERYVLDAIGGHVCRCTGYERYFYAICRVIRGLVAEGELSWAEDNKATAHAPIRFVISKRSSNDVETKMVFGWFESPTLEIAFEREGDLSSLSASVSISFEDMRTGIEVRDLNIRQFLLAPYTSAKFSLASAHYVDGARALDTARSAGAVPVALEGTLSFAGAARQTPMLQIRCTALLSALDDGRLRIVSSAPIEFDLADLGLAVAEFASEFGLHLDAVVDLSFDIIATPTMSA